MAVDVDNNYSQLISAGDFTFPDTENTDPRFT